MSDNERLNVFLHEYAKQNQFDFGLGVTYLAADEGILGYVTLSGGQVDAALYPKTKRRHPRYPHPVLRISRLAVAAAAARRGIGTLLVAHAWNVAQVQRLTVGCSGLLTDAKPEAVAFYREKCGFVVIREPAAPGDATVMLRPLDDA